MIMHATTCQPVILTIFLSYIISKIASLFDNRDINSLNYEQHKVA